MTQLEKLKVAFAGVQGTRYIGYVIQMSGLDQTGSPPGLKLETSKKSSGLGNLTRLDLTI